jgi:universal stress protein family protein
MSTFNDQPIVVGLDRWSHRLPAAYAAAEAVARGAPLHLLHATGTPAVPVDLYGSMAVEPAARDVVEKLLDRMTRSIATAYPTLAIESHLVSGPAAAALVTASIGARLQPRQITTILRNPFGRVLRDRRCACPGRRGQP